jgi:hypothetical protein
MEAIMRGVKEVPLGDPDEDPVVDGLINHEVRNGPWEEDLQEGYCQEHGLYPSELEECPLCIQERNEEASLGQVVLPPDR